MCATESWLRAAIQEWMPIIPACMPWLCVLPRPCIPCIACALPALANVFFLELRQHCVTRRAQDSTALSELEAGRTRSEPSSSGASVAGDAEDGALESVCERCMIVSAKRHSVRCEDRLRFSWGATVMHACPKSAFGIS